MISEKLRKVENLHIIFWLIKDTCWCMLSKGLGIAMIFPTILIALYMVLKTRNSRVEFAHNLAVLFWISANSTWMCGEFYCDDCTRPFALALFFAGLAVIVIYYTSILLRRIRRTES